MAPSAGDFERAVRALPHLDRYEGWLRTYRGCDFPEFIASLQDNLEAAARYEFLHRLVRAMLRVASALRLEGD